MSEENSKITDSMEQEVPVDRTEPGDVEQDAVAEEQAAEEAEATENQETEETADPEESTIEVEEELLDGIMQGEVAVEVEIEGDLVLKEVIGEGYYGPVYRVGDEDDNIDFAVKILPQEISNDQDLLDKVRDSFDKASFLNHPNIACVSHLHEVVDDSPVAQELGVCNGSQLVVMEYVLGDTVSNWSKQFENNKVDFESAITICAQVAEALDYAHSQDMTHRYIKPGNVMISVEGEVKILDFGIAAEVHSLMSRFKGAHTDKVPTHLAPEQWSGKRLGPACDQYALATMFYQLICGEVPFASALDVGVDVMKNCIINDEPEQIDELTPQQWTALKRGLAKTAEERYASCSELISALKGEIEVVDEAPAAPVAPEKPEEDVLPIGLIALIVIGVIVAILIFASRNDQKNEPEQQQDVKIAEVQVTEPAVESAPVEPMTLPVVSVPVETVKPVVAETQDLDLDKDGIPNTIEEKYGLNPLDASDALADNDGDGFSNIAELTGVSGNVKLDKKSDLKNPMSHPSLTYRLYLSKISNKTLLPLIIQKVETSGSNKNAWAALIKYAHPKGTRSEYMSIGDIIKLKSKEYIIKDITPNVVEEFDKSVNSKRKVNRSIISLKEVKGSKFVVAIVGDKVFDTKQSAIVVDAATGKSMQVTAFDVITLGDTRVGTESFTITKIDEAKKSLTLLSKSRKALYTVGVKNRASGLHGK